MKDKDLSSGQMSVNNDTVNGQVVMDQEPLQLKRNIGLVSGIAYIAGMIIGSGIWITPQGVLRNTGSVGLSLILWCVGGVIAMFGMLTYCELISVVRKAGGDYAIFVKTLGRIPGFLFIWTAEIARNPSSRAVQTITFATYLSEFLDVCGSPIVIKKLIGASALILVCIVNCYSTLLGARVQVIFTTLKVAALFMIIIGGLVAIAQGQIADLPTGFEGSITTPSSIARALLSVGFSYAGWNNLNYVFEEVKNPRRNIILSAILGTILVTFVYIMTNLSYLAILTRAEMFQSEAIALAWGQKMLGPAAFILPLAVMISTLGSMNGSLGTLTSRSPPI
ncbi:b(0,+)-type amino acid transporter 1-like [Gigantopelta aegis]|uniref:b(0,+)-type amino acid transporter 1-like n=1 Tax=Gigantopelta aegis TaxID=1735272 RepID=UPI001B889D08|nr:b(0,+)-type amino acid transporter 1-like [Gigantopelta aegis]